LPLLQCISIFVSFLITATCVHFGIDEKQLCSASKRQHVSNARVVVGRIATWELSISGFEEARRLNEISLQSLSDIYHYMLGTTNRTMI